MRRLFILILIAVSQCTIACQSKPKESSPVDPAAIASIIVGLTVGPTVTATATATEEEPKTKEEPKDEPIKPQVFDEDAIKNMCTDKWSKRGTLDANMFHDCVRLQKEALQKLNVLINKYGDQQWFEDLFVFVVVKWSPLGTMNYQMVNFSLDNENDKRLDMEYEQKKPNFAGSDADTKLTDCFANAAEKFPSSLYSMTMFCYKRP